MNGISFLAAHPERQCGMESQGGEANLLFLPIHDRREILDCIHTVFRKISSVALRFVTTASRLCQYNILDEIKHFI